MFYLYRGDPMGFREVEKPRLLQVNYSLARQFKEMERFPRDRELKPSLMAYLRDQVKKGQFRGSEWVEAYCLENQKTFRMNGKHTSTLLCEMLEKGEKQEDGAPINVRALVRKYECDTMEDCALLFSTFDPAKSSRNKTDVLRGFAASCPQLDSVSSAHLNLANAALAYNLWEQQAYGKPTEDQARLMLQNWEFVVWVHSMTPDRSGRSKYKHMIKMAVVAAMARTWFKDKAKAEEFWLKIRDDCDDPKDSPPRKLYRWLLGVSLSRQKGDKKEPTTDKEVMVCCMHAWNAWRRNENTSLRFHTDKPIPAAA